MTGSTRIAFRFAAPLLLGLCLLIASCVSIAFQENPSDHEDDRERLQQQLAQNPSDAEALRELGEIYLRTSRFDSAGVYLEQAVTLAPDDPETLFLLGLTREKLNRPQEALQVYEQYVSLPALSRYRKPMQARYIQLRRANARQEIQIVVAQEEQLSDTGLSPDVVAVFPLTYRGQEERFAPLGRGLAEMISIDLAQVDRLTIVERVRLQALIDELALAQTNYVDPTTAPRTGRLLQAGRVVTGSYNVLEDDNLLLDASAWEAQAPAPPQPEALTDDLRNFFDLEKRLVFNLIDEMDIELTPEERLRIETIPTNNLQAFLAYSRGLESEDAGNYQQAAQFYQQALRLDPNFSAAAEGVVNTSGLGDAAGTTEEAFLDTFGLPTPVASPAALIGDRLGNLGTVTGTGTSVDPTTRDGSGPVTRDPAEEAATVIGELSTPPPPPPRGGGNR